MENLIILFICWIILGYLLWHLKIYIEIQYTRNTDNDKFILEVYTLRKLIIYRLKIPVIEFTSENLWLKTKLETDKGAAKTHIKKEKRSFKKSIRIVKHYQKIYYRFMDRLFIAIKCEKLIWKTIYGSEDAALASVITGGIWGLKSIIVNSLHHRICVVNKPLIQAIPQYNQQKFGMDFTCIFSIRLGNVINAAIKMLKP